MKLGNKLIFFLLITLLIGNFSVAEDQIISSPLINLNQIKPSFEDPDDKNETIIQNQNLKKKKKKNSISNLPYAILIGLDKITAKSSEIVVNLNQKEQFGPLEIKILKCAKIKMNNKLKDVAYMQVKDLTKSDNEQVFIFNGWTFSSDPSIASFDHAIYDLQLLNCFNV